MLLSRFARLLILIKQGKQVGLQRPLLLRRPADDVSDQILVVRLRIPQRLHASSATRRPPTLRHHHPDAFAPGLLHRVVNAVNHRIEEVPILEAIVENLNSLSSKQSVVELHLGGVSDVGKVRVYVH